MTSNSKKLTRKHKNSDKTYLNNDLFLSIYCKYRDFNGKPYVYQGYQISMILIGPVFIKIEQRIIGISSNVTITSTFELHRSFNTSCRKFYVTKWVGIYVAIRHPLLRSPWQNQCYFKILEFTALVRGIRLLLLWVRFSFSFSIQA